MARVYVAAVCMMINEFDFQVSSFDENCFLALMKPPSCSLVGSMRVWTQPVDGSAVNVRFWKRWLDIGLQARLSLSLSIRSRH